MAIFDDFNEDIMEVFMDEFSVYGSIFESFLANLDKVLAMYVKVKLVLDWEKCQFMVKKGIILGHLVSAIEIEVYRDKIEVIENFQPPKIIREVQSFLEHASFYRRFMKDVFKITKPLTGLLMKNVEFIFDERCHESFQLLKSVLISTPIIQPPDWREPFEIMCDASDYIVLHHEKIQSFHQILFIPK